MQILHLMKGEVVLAAALLLFGIILLAAL